MGPVRCSYLVGHPAQRNRVPKRVVGRISAPFSLTLAPQILPCARRRDHRCRLARMGRWTAAVVILLCAAGPIIRARRSAKRSPQPTAMTWRDVAAGGRDIRGPKIYSNTLPRHSKIVHVAGTPWPRGRFS